MSTTITSSEIEQEHALIVPLRLLFAVVLLGAVVAAQWPTIPPPDFQVWVASDAIAASGANPYETDVLNEELRSDPETYGEVWQDTSGQFRVNLFSPPMWLALLKILAFSPLAMSAVGLLLLSGSVVALSRDRDGPTFVGYVLVVAIVLLSPIAQSSLRFGQSGLLLAGLIGLRLIVADTLVRGVPLALLSFKPHIALAAALPSLARRMVPTVKGLVPPAVALLVLTAGIYGVAIFGEWIASVIANDSGIVAFDDITLRTLSPRWPLPASLNTITLIIAFVATVAISRRMTADVSTLVLLSIALTVFLSGHGFAHDWLWIVLIPVVYRWSLVQSIVGACTVVVIHGLNHSITFTTTQPVVSSTSIVGLFVIGYLGWQAFSQSRTAEADRT